MSRLGDILRGKDDTRPWAGRYAPYDLVKEACIAVAVITVLAVVLTVLFSSPDDRPSTIAVIEPLKTVPDNAALQSALSAYQAAPEKTQKTWGEAYVKPLEEYETAVEEKRTPPKTVAVEEATGAVTVQASGAGPVPTMMGGLLSLAQSGGLDGSLLTSRQFFQTDYTKPLLFMADGGLLAERAEGQHLLGGQWGMMSETGSYPGQAWLWLYALWYQVEPFKTSANADILVMLVMGVLSLAFVCVPFLPGIRSLPRRIPVYRLIWREHYRGRQDA